MEKTIKQQISEFLKPDDLWNIFGIKSQEDFIEKLVCKGKFHANVPKEIKDDYIIVERLLFFSYFKYPLIDEAFGKSTRIFEASIDLKIKNLNIEKKGFESLNSKINRLEKYSSIELHKQWLDSKALRNLFAHHEAGRLMGITLMNAFKHNINMINTVFLTKKEISEKEDSLLSIVNKSNHLKEGLFILEYKNKSFLICSMIPYTSIVKNNVEMSFWVLHPVYGKKNIVEISNFPDPFMLNLKNLNINENGLSAEVIETNEIIKVTSTDKFENKEIQDYHFKQMVEIDLKLKRVYSTLLQNNLNKKVTEFIYNYTWK